MVSRWRIFRDKSVVVTGGTSGIGRASALRLARAGASLTLSGRDEARAEAVVAAARGEGVDARMVLGDLRLPGQAERLVDVAMETRGKVDAFVHAAAGFGQLGPLWTLDDAEIERGLLDELRATTRLCRALAQRVIEREPAATSVVLIASVNGLGAAASAPLYSGVKAATIALAKSLALDGAAIGLRANALAPGAIDTRRCWPTPWLRGPGPYLKDRAPGGVAEAAAWLCFGCQSLRHRRLAHRRRGTDRLCALNRRHLGRGGFS